MIKLTDILFEAASPDLIRIVNDAEKNHGVHLDIYEFNNYFELKRIVVPKEDRGKGVGSQIMSDLIKYADKMKKDIFLTPSSDFGGSKTRLIDFYKRFGFKSNAGSKRDFRSKETMVRYSS